MRDSYLSIIIWIISDYFKKRRESGRNLRFPQTNIKFIYYFYKQNRQMKIIIDSRENDLYNKCMTVCAGMNVEITKESIPLGDVLLHSEKDREVAIIERKSIDDLLASIRDGRYKEQSYRLINNKTYHRHNIIYIIEGIVSNYSAAQKKQIYGAITSLSFFKGFTVLKTSSVQETAELITAMANKIDKDMLVGGTVPDYLHSHYFGGGGGGGDTTSVPDSAENDMSVSPTPAPTDYTNVVKKVKKDNITIENIHQIMLSQIPGLSGSTATQILREYKSIGGLIDALRKNPNCLDGFKIGGGGEDESGGAAAAKKPRKMNKTVIENIKNYLTSV